MEKRKRALTRRGPHSIFTDWTTIKVPVEIVDKVKEANAYYKEEYIRKKEGLSMEDMVVSDFSKEMERKTRKIVESVLKEMGGTITPLAQKDERSSVSISSSKTTKERVEDYLMNHASVEFTNTELCKQLGISGSTMREVTRNLAKIDSRFILRAGRPNKIVFIANTL